MYQQNRTSGFFAIMSMDLVQLYEERDDSLVDCLARDRDAAELSLAGAIALCPKSRPVILCLVLLDFSFTVKAAHHEYVIRISQP